MNSSAARLPPPPEVLGAVEGVFVATESASAIVRVPAYVDLGRGDRVVVSWGDRVFEGIAVAMESSVGLVVTVPYSVIAAYGSGPVDITYVLVDRAGNTSARSHPARIAVETG